MSLDRIIYKKIQRLLLFVILLLLATNNMEFGRATTELEAIDGLIKQNYEKIYVLSTEGGDVGKYISEINYILEIIEESKKDTINVLDDEAISDITETLENMVDVIDEDIIRARYQKQVTSNNMILKRLFLLAGLLILGFYFIVNPPRYVIGLDWFGEFDES